MGVYLLPPLVFSPDRVGLLIQTLEGNGIGLGGRRTKGSGCAW
jgi:hypothetical protein